MLASSLDARAEVIEANPPAPAFMVIAVPGGQLERLSSTALLQSMNTVLQSSAGIDALLLEGAHIDACLDDADERTPILCLVKAVLPERSENRGGRYLLIASAKSMAVAGHDEEVVALMVIDLERASQLVRDDADAREVDRAIRREAVLVRGAPTLLSDTAGAAAFFREQLDPVADAFRAVDPLGADVIIDVTTSTGNVELALDDRPIARIDDSVRITRVKSGARRLSVTGEHIVPYAVTRTFRPGDTVALDLRLELTHPPIYGWAYDVLTWGGLGALAAGGGLIAIGSQLEPRPCARCSRQLQPTVAAGIGLGTAGLIAAGSGLLLDDPKRSPLLDAVIAIGVGVGAGITAGLVSRN